MIVKRKESLCTLDAGDMAAGFGRGRNAGLVPASISARLPAMARSMFSSENAAFLRSGYIYRSCPRKPETEPVAVVDLVALMLHEQEKVAEIVRVGNRVAQVRFQHGAERRLTFGLAEPFNVADRFCTLSLKNYG